MVEENTKNSPPIKRKLGLILIEIRAITDKIRDDDNSSTIEGDWRFSAMVFDRFIFFYFFLQIHVIVKLESIILSAKCEQ